MTNIDFIVKDPQELIPDSYINYQLGIYHNLENINSDIYTKFNSIMKNRFDRIIEINIINNPVSSFEEIGIEYKISELSKIFFSDDISYFTRLDIESSSIPYSDFRYACDFLYQENIFHLLDENNIEYGIYLNNAGLALLDYYYKGDDLI